MKGKFLFYWYIYNLKQLPAPVATCKHTDTNVYVIPDAPSNAVGIWDSRAAGSVDFRGLRTKILHIWHFHQTHVNALYLPCAKTLPVSQDCLYLTRIDGPYGGVLWYVSIPQTTSRSAIPCGFQCDWPGLQIRMQCSGKQAPVPSGNPVKLLVFLSRMTHSVSSLCLGFTHE